MLLEYFTNYTLLLECFTSRFSNLIKMNQPTKNVAGKSGPKFECNSSKGVKF